MRRDASVPNQSSNKRSYERSNDASVYASMRQNNNPRTVLGPTAPERTWRPVPVNPGMQLKDLWNKVTDPESYWSVAAAALLTLVLTCVVLVYYRPELVLQRDADGNVQGLGGETRLSVPRLIGCAAGAAVLVAGVCLAVKYYRSRPKSS
jgi:hypothetical protein